MALGLLAVGAVGCASKTHTKPVDASIIPKLAGQWTGYVMGPSGSANNATLTVAPNGTWRVANVGSDIVSTGTVSVADGQLVFKRTTRSGPPGADPLASGTLDYQESEDGKMQKLSGFGSSDQGPLSVTFTKRPQ